MLALNTVISLVIFVPRSLGLLNVKNIPVSSQILLVNFHAKIEEYQALRYLVVILLKLFSVQYREGVVLAQV